MTIDKVKLLEIKEKPPVFIIGCQRSGTSFCYRFLSETLDIGFGRDNNLFLNFFKRLDKYGDLAEDVNLFRLLDDIANVQDFKKRFKNIKINSDNFIACLDSRQYSDIVRCIYSYWALENGKSRWGGKTPDYTYQIDLLCKLFPDVKIIHIIRDGRDNALSFYSLPWGPKDIYVAANYWKERVICGSTGKMLPQGTFIEIRYEEFLVNPRKIFTRLIEFLKFKEIDFDEKIHEFNVKIIPKIKRNNTFKWKRKMSSNDIRIFEITAGEQLEEKGYEIVNKNYRDESLTPLSKAYHHTRNIFIKVFKKYL